MGSTTSIPDNNIQCSVCQREVCTHCKQDSHLGRVCQENEALQQLQALAKEKKWQTCPTCGAVVELLQGCYHMTCHCRAEFCYLCAVRWKNCKCEQWDEDRLITAAGEGIRHEMGRRAEVENPLVFQNRVRRRREELMERHDCAMHNWRLWNGPGQCEECRHHLDRYLLVSQCTLSACYFRSHSSMHLDVPRLSYACVCAMFEESSVTSTNLSWCDGHIA